MNWRIFDGSSEEWDSIVAACLDSVLHQSSSWEKARNRAGWSAIRLLSMDDKRSALAAVQVQVKRMIPGVAVCSVTGGPVGDLKLCGDAFRQTLHKVVGAPLLYCRINVLRGKTEEDGQLMQSLGWRRPSYPFGRGMSLEYDLRLSEEHRQVATSGNWRRNLKRSNNYGLQIEKWENPQAKDMIKIYQEMEALKDLDQQFSLDELQAILLELGSQLVVMRCLDKDGNTIAVRGAGIFGNRAWDLIAAATVSARKVYASHALLWGLLAECRLRGAEFYDLGGVDPINKKGVYDFKKGTGAADLHYLGEWEWSNVPGLCTAVNLLIRLKDPRR